MDLFEIKENEGTDFFQPLAYRMRPNSLDELLGQENIAGKGSLLQRAIAADKLFSMILWGPPGCGKTTLANIIAKETSSHFTELSAVLSGVKDIREVIERANERKRLYRKRTLLFVDEIHRFNKAQQDAFLPHVEKGTITLVGATTENPSFEVIPALISRCRVIRFNRLSHSDLKKLMNRALSDKEKGLGYMDLKCTEAAMDLMASFADGDVRVALTNLETVALFVASQEKETIDVEEIEKSLQKKALRYDKSGEEHYNLISAFHKSLRGSDPDGALYWLTRMIMAGEDPFYILRRMVRFATEDVGMADPGALTATLNALESFRFLGHPEGDDAIAQAAVYLATAPKSNSIYKAFGKVRKVVEETGYLPVPMHIRNAPTRMMKQAGYGAGYKYAHDYEEGYVPQKYLPSELDNYRFYEPSDRGYEKSVAHRLDVWAALKKKNGHT
ncbi:Replication-associated recombination protein A [Desulfamplus magnetovallimortis]|uniref:Replication-associated recombination protein A n=1 Tax=Desulfamplus magnetovallimortis TaxID=1246637 RepID=A0A1W1H5Q0_9BACT|nr:replication-associated recombination protein A [Desulfamplus magnetovallimortis]SLM27810.1 Replication-associated recombination protein A [Desulfamplus magnetovallimortis]